jgi:hypothetical protein
VTVIVSLEVLLAASRAVTVMAFEPEASGIGADQEVVPVAVPLPPVAGLAHVTEVTPTASDAVPPTVIGVEEVDAVLPEVGAVMEIAGGVVSPGV